MKKIVFGLYTEALFLDSMIWRKRFNTIHLKFTYAITILKEEKYIVIAF